MTDLTFWILLFYSSCTAQFQPTPIKSTTLTTFNTAQNGANVTILDTAVVSITNSNPHWVLDIPSYMSQLYTDQLGWDMLINLNESWGFHPSKESTISFTIYSDQQTGGSDKDIIISFSVGNSQYFSIFVALDNVYGNAIYPLCGGSLASGNINDIVNKNPYTDREAKALGGSCCSSDQRLQPEGSSYDNYWPITFIMKNNPKSNRLYVTVSNPRITQSPAGQNCEYSSSFTAGKGLQIYIGSDEIGDQAVYLKQFKIEYSFDLTYPPTSDPTVSPTKTPTEHPTPAPTANPIPAPTEHPTALPTNNPTVAPTPYPTPSPTETPTVSTAVPTVTPSNNPTESPDTRTPSVSPSTSKPTSTPSKLPTLSPITKTPTLSPIKSVIIVAGKTPSPINGEGAIEEEQSTTNAGNADVDGEEISMDSGESNVIYYIIGVLILCCCFGSILATLYVQRRRKKQSKLERSKHKLSRINIENNKQKYGAKLDRIMSVSRTNTPNISNINEISCEPQHFQNNLTSVVGVNDMLMDDIVNEMNNNGGNSTPVGPGSDENKVTTPRLPPPPKRMKSGSNQSDNINIMDDYDDIEMAIITPNGDEDTEETQETDDITDETGTNERDETPMDDDSGNQNDDDDDNDDLDLLDDITINYVEEEEEEEEYHGNMIKNNVHETKGNDDNANLEEDEFEVDNIAQGMKPQNNNNNNYVATFTPQ